MRTRPLGLVTLHCSPDSHGSFAPPQTHLLSRDMERKPVVSDPSCRTSGVWLSLKADGIISIAEI